jgi:hypothetical protein
MADRRAPGESGECLSTTRFDFSHPARAQSHPVRRFWVILLVLAFAILATGLPAYLHQMGHEAEHARSRVTVAASVDAPPGHGQDGDRDDACDVCHQLHLPAVASARVPLLVCLGLFVTSVTQVSPRLAPQRFACGITCRGPPAL